jgi:hypothetical protein
LAIVRKLNHGGFIFVTLEIYGGDNIDLVVIKFDQSQFWTRFGFVHVRKFAFLVVFQNFVRFVIMFNMMN